MLISKIIDRILEIDAERRDEGYQSQYDTPEQPGEYQALENALISEIGDGGVDEGVFHKGLVWYLDDNDDLCCDSAMLFATG